MVKGKKHEQYQVLTRMWENVDCQGKFKLVQRLKNSLAVTIAADNCNKLPQIWWFTIT